MESNKEGQLVKKQDEYIEFLGECEADCMAIAQVHHFKHSEETMQKARMFREEIATLKSEVSEVAESRNANEEAQKVAIRVIQEVIEKVRPTPRFVPKFGEIVPPEIKAREYTSDTIKSFIAKMANPEKGICVSCERRESGTRNVP